MQYVTALLHQHFVMRNSTRCTYSHDIIMYLYNIYAVWSYAFTRYYCIFFVVKHLLYSILFIDKQIFVELLVIYIRPTY